MKNVWVASGLGVRVEDRGIPAPRRLINLHVGTMARKQSLPPILATCNACVKKPCRGLPVRSLSRNFQQGFAGFRGVLTRLDVFDPVACL